MIVAGLLPFTWMIGGVEEAGASEEELVLDWEDGHGFARPVVAVLEAGLSRAVLEDEVAARTGADGFGDCGKARGQLMHPAIIALDPNCTRPPMQAPALSCHVSPPDLITMLR